MAVKQDGLKFRKLSRLQIVNALLNALRHQIRYVAHQILFVKTGEIFKSANHIIQKKPLVF